MNITAEVSMQVKNWRKKKQNEVWGTSQKSEEIFVS